MVGEKVHTILGTEEFGGLGSSLALASLTVGRGGAPVARWGGAGARWWRWGRVGPIVGRAAGHRPAGFISTRLAAHPTWPKVGDTVEEVATISGAYEVGKFGMVVREAAGGSGLLVR